jgi:hypothetical protein
MELDVNGAIVKNPSAADIVGALDAPTFAEDWYIALKNESGVSLDALADAHARFTLSFGDDNYRQHIETDAATVKAVYLKFLAGDPSWRQDCAQQALASTGGARLKFVPDARPLQGKSGDQPPLPAVIVMVAVISLVGFAFAIEHWAPGTIGEHVPYGDSDLFWIGLIFLPMVALVIVAVATKLIQFRAAKGWAQTTGRIVSSGIEVRRHQFDGEPETVKNVPALRYEFQVGARKVIGSRIGIGDDTIASPEATLKRYPVGATVTVYYDQNDPTECVLERGGPQVSKGEAMSGCAGGIALLALFGGAIYWLFTRGPDFIRAHFPQAKADPRFSIFAICFGLVTLMFFVAARRYSKQAAAWPSVRGKVVSSKVEQFEERDSEGRSRTSYRPAVEYAYVVGGRELHGNQIKLMMQMSGSESLAVKTVAKYPAGSAVDVHYDPADPTKTALENPTGATWIIAVIALAMFALAAWSLGVFG